jgi:hypothetical protein
VLVAGHVKRKVVHDEVHLRSEREAHTRRERGKWCLEEIVTF